MSKAAGQLKGRAARLTRLMPAGPSNAARTPFVLLVVLLLGGGLITLLVLNSALNEGSFRLSELKKRTTDLTDEQQALQHDVDSSAEPDALARRARELGMVPGGSPVFLGPDGKIRGVPSAATSEPAPAPPQKTTAPPQPPRARRPPPVRPRPAPPPRRAPPPPAPARPRRAPRRPRVPRQTRHPQAPAGDAVPSKEPPRRRVPGPARPAARRPAPAVPAPTRDGGPRPPRVGRPRAPAPAARCGSAARAPGSGWSASP